jgi:serine/threonine protein kinase
MSLEGQQIDRYRILRLLGSGGMGDVYLAEDARIEQQVAIKVIRAEASPYPDKEASQEAARLFQREAKAIVKLDHPHILPLYDYGEERLGNMTIIYLVMPYRKEGSLTDWLRQRGQAGLLCPQDVAHLVGQAASALQHAHDHQIIHQDVKPSNFLIRHRPEKPERPDLLLADFGIAKFTTATSAMSHTIRGTPTYMAPEQWEGHPVPATDQYALAVMTYELLTGRSPFQGGERQVMYQHLMVPPAPPSTLNPHLSRDTDTVLLHALSKEPEQRFASMTAFFAAFQQALQAQATQETAAPTSYLSAPPTPPPTPVSQGDIRAVLAISTGEAQMGTTRTLTLPGGRKVTVPVPAGAHDGQIVRLDGQGEIASAGGPVGALILSILVKAAEDPPSLSTGSAAAPEATVLTAKPQPPAPSMPTVSTTDQQARFTAQRPSLTTGGSQETLQPAQRGISRRTVVLGLAGLTVVSVAGSGLLWLTRSQQPSEPSALASPTVPPPATPSPFPTTLSVGIADHSVGAIKTSSGNYLTAVNNGGLGGPNAGPGSTPIHTDATQVGSWEKFTFVEQSGGKFALRTVRGNYVTAVKGGGIGGPNNSQYPIHTDATQVESWETFTFLKQPDGTFAIRTGGGFYLTAVNGGGWGEAANQYPIHTDATQVGSWETFTFVPIG